MDALATFVVAGGDARRGFGAGFFALYAHTIMPGLAATDVRTYLAALSAIDRPSSTRGSPAAALGPVVFGELAAAWLSGVPDWA